MSIAILAQAQIAKMFDQHELPGYVITTIPTQSMGGPMEFSTFFGACAVIARYGASDQDKEDANFVHVSYQENIRGPIVRIICAFLKKRPPKAHNLISGQGGWGMTSLTQDIMDLVDNAWMAHIQDWAAFEGPSPINITAVRMAGFLWLSYLRVPGQSWKPLTHCTYVDPPICDPEIQMDQ